MRLPAAGLTLLLLCAAAAPGGEEAPTPSPLLPNGDFQTPAPDDPQRPLGWDRPDGLGVQWTEAPDGDRGKAIRIDTRVSEEEMVRSWREAGLEQWDIPKPAANPVAATYGLSYYSEAVPVRPGQAYRIRFAFRGAGGAKVWVRGYGHRRVSPRVEARQIRDWQRLASRLEAATPAASPALHHLRRALPAPLRRSLEEEGAAALAAPAGRQAFLSALNELLADEDFATAAAWDACPLAAALREDLRAVRAGGLRQSQRRHLARRLLEAALPQALAPAVERRRRWETYVQCRTGGEGWHRFAQVFHPTRHTPAVREMRVMLYAYWPPGVYWFDNAVLEPIDDEAYAAGKEAGTVVEPAE